MLKWLHGREARPASGRWNVLKTILQTIVFWSVFLALLPMGVMWLESAVGLASWRFDSATARTLGIALFIAGGSLGLTSGITMAIHGRGTPLPADCPSELVIVGPYRYVRNPMAVAGITQGVAVGLFLGSPAVIGYALVGAPTWHVLVRPWEEQDLFERLGEPYREYREHVRCWWPRFRPYDPGGG